MKKLFMIISLIISLMISLYGCGPIDNENNTHSNSGENIDSGSSNNDPDLKEANTLYIGNNNIPPYENTFNTMVIYMPEKASDDYSKIAYYNIYKNTANNNQYYKENINTTYNLTPRDKLNNHIQDILNYAVENNIKPIDNMNSHKKTIPENIVENTKWNNVYVLNGNTYKTINATCIKVTDEAYFFLEDGLSKPTEEQITQIANAFSKDYKIIHQYFGKEDDIDNNKKVTFLIADFEDGLMGYFYPVDKYPNGTFAGEYSNEADVLYINHKYFNSQVYEEKKIDLIATFIHEFQHMTLFDTRKRNNLNVNVSIWLNEGLSMLAEYYGGYALSHKNYIYNFFDKEQNKSLITNDSSQNYGLSLLFARYMDYLYKNDYIKTIYNSTETGIKAVEEVSGKDFNEVFLDFTKMILITGRGITNDLKYNVLDFNHITGTEEYNKNGFNLSNIIDEVYSKNSNKNSYITSNGYRSKELSIYSFFITKWTGNINNLILEGNNGIKGIYYSW